VEGEHDGTPESRPGRRALVAALQTTRTALLGEGDEFDPRQRMLEEDRSAGS
jgi:hypothetical protein